MSLHFWKCFDFQSPKRHAITSPTSRIRERHLKPKIYKDFAVNGTQPALPRASFNSFVPMIAATAMAAAVFAVDTFTTLPFAVAVLYVVVISIVATYCSKLGIMLAATACAALTIVSYFVTHGPDISDTAPIRSAISVAAIMVTAAMGLTNKAMNETLRQSEKARANLARFFSPERVDQIVAIEKPFSIARRQPAAVLFVDMVGFTSFCSSSTPEAIIARLREFLELLSNSVFAHHGTIDKFLGDGLLAVFGSPESGSKDATNAVNCALAILRATEELNQARTGHGFTPIKVAIGIHYGEVIQGDVGSNKQLELTVLGDTVNVASRVEAYCRNLCVSLLVTDALIEALCCEDSLELVRRFSDHGLHQLKGCPQARRLYSNALPL